MAKKSSFKKTIISAFILMLVFALLTTCAFAAEKKLVPMGYAVGISLDAQGVMVVGYSEHIESPAKAAGIMPGDVITKIGTTDINCAEDIKNCDLSKSSLAVTISRSGESIEYTVVPTIDRNGSGELGLWLNDSLSGIGTITYYDPDTGEFGALGHPVNDIDTGVLIPMRSGKITNATITDIIHGKCGTPGQLTGIFDLNTVYGKIDSNTAYGIFGKITDDSFVESLEAIDVADAEDIHTGPATILSSIDNGSPKEYSVKITRVDSGSRDGRCLMLKVTDDALLNAAGGIVQGMSGSPIIQDGKLIGAVTHVLLNDPSKGYGISIEKMTETAQDMRVAA